MFKKLEIDCDGDTSLHFAAESGNIGLITTYITRGVNINITNNLGWTPLMFAVKNSQLRSIKTLTYLGANLSHRNNYGKYNMSLK